MAMMFWCFDITADCWSLLTDAQYHSTSTIPQHHRAYVFMLFRVPTYLYFHVAITVIVRYSHKEFKLSLQK
jgi:hypothetical protein